MPTYVKLDPYLPAEERARRWRLAQLEPKPTRAGFMGLDWTKPFDEPGEAGLEWTALMLPIKPGSVVFKIPSTDKHYVHRAKFTWRASGPTYSEAAQKAGVKAMMARNAARRQEELHEILKLHSLGKKQTEISEITGISQGKISIMLSKHFRGERV